MLEMSVSFSLNVMLSMSKMSKINQIKSPKGCNAMYVEDVQDGKRTYTCIFVQGMWHVKGVIAVLLEENNSK